MWASADNLVRKACRRGARKTDPTYNTIRPCRFRQGRFTLQTVLRALRVDVAQVHEKVDHVALVGAVHAEQLVLVAVILAQLADGHVAGEHALQVELLAAVGGAQEHVVAAAIHSRNQIIYILRILQKHHNIASFLRRFPSPKRW